MFVADFKKHNIFVFDPGRKLRVSISTRRNSTSRTIWRSPTDGTLYASDPNFGKGRGQIWRIKPGANGTGNGVAHAERAAAWASPTASISAPTGKTLYVGESNTSEIWAYRIDNDRLVEPRLVKKFDARWRAGRTADRRRR